VQSGLIVPTSITFSNSTITVADCAWTLRFIGKTNNDYYLDTNEKAVITVWLHSYNGSAWAPGTLNPFLGTNYIDTDSTFTLEIKAAKGAVLTIERTTPGYLDNVMDLH